MSSFYKKLMVIFCSLVFSINAIASLLITPTRVIFEDTDRVENVILVNTSQQTRSYTIKWVEMSQDKFGKYTVLDEDTAASFERASEFLRFSPKRVTLAPGENQKIKLMLRRNSNMTAPEYRSHLRFTALPPAVEDEDEGGNGIQIKVDVLINYSIPVIIRTTDVSFQDINYSDVSLDLSDSTDPLLHVKLKKSKAHSALGRFEVFYKANGKNNYESVGKLNGINFLHDTSELERSINLSTDISFSGGKLKVVYQSETDINDSIERIISI